MCSDQMGLYFAASQLRGSFWISNSKKLLLQQQLKELNFLKTVWPNHGILVTWIIFLSTLLLMTGVFPLSAALGRNCKLRKLPLVLAIKVIKELAVLTCRKWSQTAFSAETLGDREIFRLYHRNTGPSCGLIEMS